MTPPLVKVSEVYKSFKDVDAVQGLSFNVMEGRFLALLGPNGAGKTTMVEMIEGIQSPDRGSITIDGKKWGHHSDEIHRIIGLSLQETRFVDKLTVRETLNLFSSFYGLYKRRIDEVIELTGLEEKQKAYTVNLSGGQRQRLALGIALLNKPKVLLLDEPTTGLDPNVRREVWNILKELKKEAKTSLILTTHYMEEAEQLCDYIIIIDHGKILQEGTLDGLLKSNNGKKVVEFTLDSPLANKGVFNNNTPFHISWNETTSRGIFELENFDLELPKFLEFLKHHNLKLDKLESRKLSLDDLFISLTGRHLHE